MATARLAFSPSPSSCLCRNRVCFSSLPSYSSYVSFPYSTSISSSSTTISHSHHPFPSSLLKLPITTRGLFSVTALAEEVSIPFPVAVSEKSSDADISSGESKVQPRPCELYVCNLPRSCDNDQLLEMFKPYGGVHSVEISRNPENGVSRGCAYVTMTSFDDAKEAVTALDASDFDGREMRVRFSVDMNLKTLVPKRNIIFESPHKIYVGNLAWSVKPEHLREFFSQFGTVVSAKVLYDRKGGKNRVFGFLSFSSPEELTAAMSSDGKEFRGRNLLVRKALRSSELEP